MSASGERLLKGYLPYLWIILAGFVLYAKTLSFGFVYLDDQTLILENFAFLHNLANVFQAFRQDIYHLLPNALPYYRPLLMVSFIADAAIGGLSPVIYHLSNIIFHLFASCLVFALLLKMNYDRTASFVLALVFTVHPALAQAVAWIPGRNDSLLAVFIFASFWFYLQYLGRGGRANYAAHLALLLLALFTKETAIILAAASLLYLHLIVKEKLFSKREAALLAGWLFVLGLWFFCRQAAHLPTFYAPLKAVLIAALQNMPALVQFTGKIFFPVNLSVCPLVRDTSLVYGAAAVMLLAIFLALGKAVDRSRVLFGFIWFFLFLIPTLFYWNPTLSGGTNLHLEHRLYVPLLGMFLVLLETNLFKNNRLPRATLIVLSALLIGSLLLLTNSHLENFRDQRAFWSNAACTSPHLSMAHSALGLIYYYAGEPEKAVPEFRRAIELKPSNAAMHNALGAVYLRKGRFPEAEQEFRTALRIDPSDKNARQNLSALPGWRARARKKLTHER
jgi:protein O-mannosyl-transferase